MNGKNKQKIKKEMMESAIDGLFLSIFQIVKNILGLSKGYMDYAIDPILPIVKQSIKVSVQKINNLPLAE